MVAKIIIEERYSGPPLAGNGGYVSGRVAEYLGGGPVAVTLLKPTPLGLQLVVRDAGEDAVMLMHDGDAVVTAERATPMPDPIEAPDFSYVKRALPPEDYHEAHLYPGCFVCGPHRHDGDGMCIHPAVLGPGMVGSVWTPPAEFGDGTGHVRNEFLWSALDCPGSFAPFNGVPPRPMVLGRFMVDVKSRPEVGEPLMVVGWRIVDEGRKHKVGTAIYSADGQCHAQGRAVWIELKPKTQEQAAA